MNCAVVANPIAGAVHEEHLRSHLQDTLGFDLGNIDISRLIGQLKSHEQEFGSFEEYASALASLIAVHETYFLRHPDQFLWLQQVWLPQWLARHPHPGKPLRILSAGCATGEEPYSLVAHLQPLLAQAGRQLVVEGVDVSQRALATAQRGRYGLWSLRGVDVHREQWLHVDARSVEVMDWVRHAVRFRHHNLACPLDTTLPYDLILCRNVLIYMHEAAVGQIMHNLAGCLAANGVLLLGPSDPNPPAASGLQVQWSRGVRVVQHVGACAWPDPAARCDGEAVAARELARAEQGSPARVGSGGVRLPQGHAAIEALIHTGYYSQARELLEERLAADPLDVRSHVMLAMLSMDLDDQETAQQAARNASFLEPTAIFPAYLLANIRLRQGDAGGARAEAMWVYRQLEQYPAGLPVPYCEEITVGQLKEVVSAGL